MKILSIILVVTGLLLSGCGSKELSKEEALVLLIKDKSYATPARTALHKK